MCDKLKSLPDISLSTPRFENEAIGFARDMAQYDTKRLLRCWPVALRLQLNPDDLAAFSYEGFRYEPTLGEPAYPHFIRQ